MKTQTTFRSYEPDQLLLLPEDMREWLPEDHLAHFVRDVVAELDLSEIFSRYDGSKGGHPPYHPTMMTGLLIYGYCVGIRSSRRIEKACWEQVPFRVLAAGQNPDHDTIAEFRRRHIASLPKIFLQALNICREAGLVKLGHVALDGTKMQANASKHKSMSYDHMNKKEKELEEAIARLLNEAEDLDRNEDQRFGKGRRGDELPEELRFKQNRLLKIKAAKAALETEAKDAAKKAGQEQEKRDDGKGPKHGGSASSKPTGKPADKAQRNFTDPESRIMMAGATKSFEQCYNCQTAVDDTAQVIVATYVTQEANDKQQIKPMFKAIKKNLGRGSKPKKLSADAGYWSEDNANFLEAKKIDAYVATGRMKRTEKQAPPPRGRIPDDATAKQRMARKLRTLEGKAVYKMRKAIVEPVFGQIKFARGTRQFLLRGLEKVSGEWALICAGHNFLKLFNCGWRPSTG
jgi:transposase